MNRIAITGSSGYLVSRLVEHFRGLVAAILGIDVQPPHADAATQPYEFSGLDVCDESVGAPFRPDTIIHGAFAFRPLRDEEEIRRVNIDGTRNVLCAVAQIQPARLLVVSSATAYGAWPDNPISMDENWPLRARTEFRYAADKTEVERMVQTFARQQPEIAGSTVRPALIGGPHMNNDVSRFIFGMPLLLRLDGEDGTVQFVHEDDDALAIAAILQANAKGAFKVAPPDWTTVMEIARLTHRLAIQCPLWLARWLHGFAGKIRFPIHESAASFLCFARYPWVVSPSRLANELGYQFKYSCRDTLQRIINGSKLGETRST
jgi:UDP-glucose 4-epimerase